MHVASSYLAALSLSTRSRWLFGAWLVWATVIAISTVTAKQHYVVDVVAGLALAFVFWALFFRGPLVSSVLAQLSARHRFAQHP
jgi:membrane-associated phospholipid phosphatase